MVWLTGGGNHSFSGQGAPTPIFGGVVYNGEQLVPQGVVFVSYNLCLGALGFLAHPALDAERPEKTSGNYSSLDQIAMLQWINRNIAAFGGDPPRFSVRYIGRWREYLRANDVATNAWPHPRGGHAKQRPGRLRVSNPRRRAKRNWTAGGEGPRV
jgi:Carboxylesterase family